MMRSPFLPNAANRQKFARSVGIEKVATLKAAGKLPLVPLTEEQSPRDLLRDPSRRMRAKNVSTG